MPAELTWLEDFLVLARTGNFSQSARERGVTQSAFSRRIQALEAWFDVPLVDRTHQPFSLTEEGRLVRNRAAEIAHIIQTTRIDVVSSARSSPSHISLAVLHTLAITFLPTWLSVLRAEIEPFRSRLIVDDFGNCIRSLAEGDVDFLVSYIHPSIPLPLASASVHGIVVGEDSLVAVGTPELIQGADDGPLPLLAYSRDSFLGRLSSLAQMAEDAPPVYFAHTNETAMADAYKFMVLAGLGISWLPHSLIKGELADGRLISVGHALPMHIALFRKTANHRRVIHSIWSASQALKPGQYVDEEYYIPT